MERDADLSNVCNALLALCYEGTEGEDEECVEGYRDALRVFLVSLVPGKHVGGGGGSFNDPMGGRGEGGFVWNSFD